jgi:hypothetical protein
VVVVAGARRVRLTRLIAMGLLDTAGRGSGLASGLGGELLARGLATSGFTCGMTRQ